MKLVLKNTSLDFKYINFVRETIQKTVVSYTSVGNFIRMGTLNVPIPAGKTCKVTLSLSSYVNKPRVVLIEDMDINKRIIDLFATEPVVKTYTTAGAVSSISIQLIANQSVEYTATVIIEYEE